MGPQVHNEERSGTGEKVLTVNRFAAVIALFVSLLPAVIIYTQASNQFAILNHTVTQLETALRDQSVNRENYRAGIESRLRSVEDRVARGQQDLSHALATWERIDNRLERLEERLLNGTGTDSRTPR